MSALRWVARVVAVLVFCAGIATAVIN